jgi:hypothetical protein
MDWGDAREDVADLTVVQVMAYIALLLELRRA